MSAPQPIRQPLAVRFLVAPVLRLALAASLLLCLLAFQLLHLARKLTGRAEPAKPVDASVTRKRPMHMGNALAALKLTQKLADECGAKPFLISGTLLGIHRNGALLTHDNDIDLGIMADDPALGALVERLRTAPEVVRFSEKRLGYVARTANPWIPRLRDDVLLYKINLKCLPDARPVRMDLFVHFTTRGFVAHGSNRTLWINSPFSISKMKLEGAQFWAPEDRVRYLTENYSDFSVPKINFESSVDCPNCVNILTFPACLTLMSKWEMFKTQQDPSRKALIKQRICDYIMACISNNENWEMRTRNA